MTEKKSLRDLKLAERVIDQLASEAHDKGMLIRAWHGPRQSRLYVSRWAGGSEPVSAGYVEVERSGRPPSTQLRVNWKARTEIDRLTLAGLAERAKAMLGETHASE